MPHHCTSNSDFERKELGQLDSWTPMGIAKHINLQRFVCAAMDSNLPPWRPIPSRAAARLLGVTLNSLAQWRMREVGPKSEPWLRGGGNRVYYRPDRLAEWLSDGRCAAWQFSGWWLQAKGLASSDTITEELVEVTVRSLDTLELWPEARFLWRNFRASESV
jgi:hypothetical protein